MDASIDRTAAPEGGTDVASADANDGHDEGKPSDATGGRDATGRDAEPDGDARVDGGPAPTDGGARDADAGRTSDAGRGDAPSDAGKVPVDRRLPLPCVAPLPTGFCMVSDPGDYIGEGRSYSGAGPGSVILSSSSSNHVGFRLQDTSADAGMDNTWDADFAPKGGALLTPGLFDPAMRYPFQTGGFAGLDVYGNGRGCNEVTGKFSVEELARDPLSGVTSLSITFEHHCEGGTPGLRGVINFEATGSPDRTPAPDRVISLSGKIFRVAYDPTANVAYGLDAANRRLAKIDIASGTVTYGNVVQVPNDGCVDVKRGRLFVVNKGSSLLTEYTTDDLKSVRDITWGGTDWGPTETTFEIHCAPDRLYVVDGAWSPGLFTVDGLDDANPVVTDHTSKVAGVGSLVVNEAATDLYYWYQVGWSAGLLSTSVRRLLTSDLSQIDQSSANVPSFNRDPLDAPILLDETRGLIFNKDKIFDSTNLAKVVYTLPSKFDTFNGAAENAYALDPAHGFVATKNFVYELTRYDIVAPTITTTADQMFFDTSGTLWFLSIADGALEAQFVNP
jgi:hypothetical protein